MYIMSIYVVVKKQGRIRHDNKRRGVSLSLWSPLNRWAGAYKPLPYTHMLIHLQYARARFYTFEFMSDPWTDKRMDGGMDRQMVGQKNERMDRQTDGSMFQRTD